MFYENLPKSDKVYYRTMKRQVAMQSPDSASLSGLRLDLTRHPQWKFSTVFLLQSEIPPFKRYYDVINKFPRLFDLEL